MWARTLVTIAYLCAAPHTLVASAATPPASLAAQYSLTTSTSLPFPSATQKSSDSQALIISEWSLIKGRIQDGASHLAFVSDPFPDSLTVNDTVLRVTYPAQTFGSTGGAQIENQWIATDGTPFQSMMLSYEVAFDTGFNWVQGGKLPGLRGGLSSTGCSGGNQPNGTDCFSTRLMWRPGGLGEVYAYMQRPNKLCDQKGFICNSDFGISISRGSFVLASGQWNRITMIVQLNDPPNIANGNLLLYFNDAQVMSHQNLQFRSANTVDTTGLYLSTFFGGSDDSWKTPADQHSYYRNIQLWGGNAPSTLTGQKVSAGARDSFIGLPIALVSFVLAAMVIF